MDRTREISGSLQEARKNPFPLSCPDLKGLEAICRTRARAGHQADSASLRECVRVSLREGPNPRFRDLAAWQKSRSPITDAAGESPCWQAFRENYGTSEQKMNETSFNLAQIQGKGKRRRSRLKHDGGPLLTSGGTFYTHKR